MSAAGDILVRAVPGGWIVSTGIEADGWFVTSPARLALIVRGIAEGEAAASSSAPNDRAAIDVLRSIAGRLDKLTLALADIADRQRAI